MEMRYESTTSSRNNRDDYDEEFLEKLQMALILEIIQRLKQIRSLLPIYSNVENNFGFGVVEIVQYRSTHSHTDMRRKVFELQKNCSNGKQ